MHDAHRLGGPTGPEPAPPSRIAVTIIIPTYCPGDAIHRVFDSLDALTLPVERTEVIFVDDGSPDDTAARLDSYAKMRPNTRVLRCENSGWPSRPRNIAIEAARGQYVVFMDHDDSLYPDGLRRAYEVAVEHSADIVSPKESRTNSAWFGMKGMYDGNIANLRERHGIARLDPLIPHKLYRRALLLEHGIRFPEGRRVLWEDSTFNVRAYRHSSVVSVLADTPFYLWHASDQNATNTFDPARGDYWDRLEELFDDILTALSPTEFDEDRLVLISHTLQYWVIQRLTLLLVRAEPASAEEERIAFARARILLDQHGTAEVWSRLRRKHQAAAHVMRQGSIDQLRALALVHHAVRATATASDAHWRDGRLIVDTTTTWHSTGPSVAGLRERDGRLVLDVGPELTRLIPPELLDLSDQLEHIRTNLGLRDRVQHVTWALPFSSQPPTIDRSSPNGVQVVQRGRGVIDIETAACGHPAADSVWDLRLQADLYGIERAVAVEYHAGRLPAVVGSRPAIVYRNKRQALSLDLAQRLRTLAVDAVPAVGQMGPISGFSTRLTALAATSVPARIPAMLIAVPADSDEPTSAIDAQEQVEKWATTCPFTAEVVVDDRGTRLEGCGQLPSGDYRLYARRRNGLNRTRYALTVNPAGGAQLFTV